MAVRELRGSSHIVTLYDCFEDASYMHIVLEYCDGETCQLHQHSPAPRRSCTICYRSCREPYSR